MSTQVSRQVAFIPHFPLEPSKEAERDELAAVLASEFFTRAPTLARLLDYIGRKYFAGELADLKEYNIAVEVLGRGPDFDQRRDAIVRVEAHRLRKRLKAYYETEGAEHRLRLVLDAGQYVPRFVPGDAWAAAERPALAVVEPPSEVAEAPLAEVVEEVQPEAVAPMASAPAAVAEIPKRMHSSARLLGGLRSWWAALAVTAVCGLAIWWMPGRHQSPAVSGGGKGFQARVMAGYEGGNTVDGLNLVWTADQWYEGGSAVRFVRKQKIAPGIPGPDDQIFQRQGDFRYKIPLRPGSYELKLYLSSKRIVEGSPIPGSSGRRFTVLANGSTLLAALDPSATIDHGDQVLTRVFKDLSPAQDGYLHLEFKSGPDPAYLDGLEISAAPKGRMNPIRLVAKAAPYTDREGRTWDSDRYYSGGALACRRDPIRAGSDVEDPNLFSGERYGDFKYEIPVAPGRYTVVLRFAETWFGPDLAGGGGAGSRRFDVLANGVPVVQDFDVFQAAGGAGRPIQKRISGLTPNAEGFLVLSFLTRVNNASVNSIEVLPEP